MSRKTSTRQRPARTAPKTTTDTRASLPVRPQHLTDLDANAASATLYAGSLRIHAPYNTWVGIRNDRATCLLPTGTRLMYTRTPNHIEAVHLCPHGYWHTTPITDGPQLDPFTDSVNDCTRHNPKARRAQHLGTGIHRATTAAADTQQLSRQDIDTGLAERTPTTPDDDEQTKEHPQS